VQHVQLNRLSNVTTERVIVTDRPRGRQAVAFRNSWKMFGRPSDPQPLEEVDSVSLDEYVRRTGTARLDAMKIDVDGYEYKVLTGARDTLARFRPVLMLEIGKYTLQSAGDSLEELIDFLHALGYEFFSEITLRRHRTARRLLDTVPDDATVNVVCRYRIQ
jgi:FkbM family methyltransferase